MKTLALVSPNYLQGAAESKTKLVNRRLRTEQVFSLFLFFLPCSFFSLSLHHSPLFSLSLPLSKTGDYETVEVPNCAKERVIR